MARTAKLTESIPKLAVTPEMRRRIEAVADAAEVAMSDVVRDCIDHTLQALEFQFGLISLDNLDEDELAELGVQRKTETPREDRSAGLYGGPPRLG